MTECPVCHKVGFHKLSRPTQKVTVFIPTLEEDRMYQIPMTAHSAYIAIKKRRCNAHVWRKDYLNGGKKCQVCCKAKEEVERSKDVEE